MTKNIEEKKINMMLDLLCYGSTFGFTGALITFVLYCKKIISFDTGTYIWMGMMIAGFVFGFFGGFKMFKEH